MVTSFLFTAHPTCYSYLTSQDWKMPSSSGNCDEDVGDIEDCILPGDPKPSDRIRAENRVLPRALRRKVQVTRQPLGRDEDTPVCESFIPGTHSIYIKTWGCSHNNSDGEYMSGLLGASGYSITGEYAHGFPAELFSSRVVCGLFQILH